jgi:hypothetical protein
VVGVLQRFERRLGGLVEGAFAKVFKGGVEPVELAGALTRECDERRARGARRTLVPNEFVIQLSDADYQRLAPYRQALGDELATLVREHAAAQRYTFVGPVVVSLNNKPELTVGRYEIESAVSGDAAARGAQGLSQRPTQLGVKPSPQFARPDPPAPPVAPAPLTPIAPKPAASNRGNATNPADAPPTKPMNAAPEVPRLIVSVGGNAVTGTPAAAGHELTIPLTRPSTVIGRGSDVDVQLPDTGTSRRHGELLLQPDGHHIYRDLGSTNGSRVNGRKVREAALHDGDRIEVGRSVLVYHHPGSVGPSAGRRGGELSGAPAEA